MANLIIEAFEADKSMTVLGVTDASLTVAALSTDAEATFYVKTTRLRNVFKFQSDSIDVDGSDNGAITGGDTDTQYYCYANAWLDLSINPANAPVTSSAVYSSGVAANRLLVKHDMVRFLASQMFGTHFGTDLLGNEEGLKNDVAARGSAILTDIQTAVAAANNKTNADDTTANITRRLMRQLYSSAPDRFVIGTNVTVNGSSVAALDASSGIQAVPLADGDTLAFKVTFNLATGQKKADGTDVSSTARSYKIILVCADDAGSGATVVVPNDTVGGSASSYNGQYPRFDA